MFEKRKGFFLPFQYGLHILGFKLSVDSWHIERFIQKQSKPNVLWISMCYKSLNWASMTLISNTSIHYIQC